VEWKKLKFMRDRVGEDFDGMILSATKYGLFVELQDLFVEGLVPIQSLGALDNDYYTYRENTRQIIGERWGRKFVIGQRVRVLLERVDAVQKRLQFSIVDEEGAVAAGERPTARPKAGKAAKKNRREKKSKTSMQQQGKGSHRPPKKIKRTKRHR
jgi:ribonuclease R